MKKLAAFVACLVLATSMGYAQTRYFSNVKVKQFNDARYAAFYADGGSGTDGAPWTGWEDALSGGSVRVVFESGYYEVQAGATSIAANTELVCEDGAIIRFASGRTNNGTAMFTIAETVDDVTVQGCQFEPGTTVPASGIVDPGNSGCPYFKVGVNDTTDQSQRIRFIDNHFGLARYVNDGAAIVGTQINIVAAKDVVISGNTFDAAASSVVTGEGGSSQGTTIEQIQILDNRFIYSQSDNDFGAAVQLGSGTAGSVNNLIRNLTISGNTFQNINGVILADEGGASWTVSNNVVYGNSGHTDWFLLCAPDNGATLTNVTVSGNSLFAAASGDGVGIAVGVASGVSITGNVIKETAVGTGLNYIRLGGTVDGAVASGNAVYRAASAQGTSTTGMCFHVLNATGAVVSGNICTDPPYGFLRVETGAPGLTVSGNTLYNSNASVAEYFVYGVGGTGPWAVSGNTVAGNATVSGIAQAYGTGSHVAGNQDNTGTTGYVFDTTPAYIDSTFPSLYFRDTQTTDGDNNAAIRVNADQTGTGAEDISVQIRTQVDGSAQDFIHMDASVNGSPELEIGNSSVPVEIPNGANPTTSADGHIAYDSDDDAIEVYDGTSSRLIPTLYTAQATVIDPDTVQATTDEVPILAVELEWAPHGITVVDCGIKIDAVGVYVVGFEEWTSPTDGAPSTIENVSTGAATTEAADGGTLSDSAIAAGSIIMIDLPPTAKDYLQVWLTYYVNEGD